MRAQRVTAAFFTVLRQQPVIGRAFTADNEIDGQHQVAVLSATGSGAADSAPIRPSSAGRSRSKAARMTSSA